MAFEKNIDIQKNKSFNYNLEALRGYAALFVVISHIILYDTLLDPYFFPSFLKLINISGHFCVLIFFVLSGYVIGISTKNIKDYNTMMIYIKKRSIRIYPIYILSVLTVILFFTVKYSFFTIVGNLTFLQILVTPVIWEISPIWSLHYEVVFYLLFIPISYFNFNSSKLFTIIVSIGFGAYVFHLNPLISSYCFGFSFWLTGLIIAQNFIHQKPIKNNNILVSSLFLILCLPFYNVFSLFFSKTFKRITLNSTNYSMNFDWYHRAITYEDFAYFPYCILFVLLFSGKEFKYKTFFIIALLLVPAVSFYHFFYYLRNPGLMAFIIATLFYLLSIMFFFYKAKIV